MHKFNKLIMLIAALVFPGALLPTAQAEKITLTLSQEQDGGPAGKACLYVHQGKAEYQVVQPDEMCPATLTVNVEENTAPTRT